MTDPIHTLYLDTLGADKAARKAAVAETAARLGLQSDTVRKKLDKLGRARSEPRARATDPELEAAVNIVWEFKLTPDGPIATEAALQLAISEGRLFKAWPVGSLNAAAKRLGLSEQAAYCRRMEAPHANRTHRVDASGSRHFQVVEDAGDGDWLLRVCRAEQRNKRWRGEDASNLLWIVTVIDDYSRVFNVGYQVAPGESAAMIQRFLVETWRDAQPRGLPEVLIADNGSFAKETSSKALLAFFDIQLITGQPYNSQRNGRVERPIRTIKEGFERPMLATHDLGSIVRLSQLKEELKVFIAGVNGSRHPIRRDRTKREDWERGMAFRELRECPQDALHYATWREQRTVTAEGAVQHKNKLLEIVDLPYGLRGRKITLCYNASGEIIAEHEGARYAVRGFVPVTLGGYESQAHTGRGDPPSKAAAAKAEARQKTGVGFHAPERQAAIKAAGEQPHAPGEQALPGAGARVITPPPRIRDAVQVISGKTDPFQIASDRYKTVDEAVAAVQEIVGKPSHVWLNKEQRQTLEKILRGFDLDRRKTAALADRLRQQSA